VDSDGLIDFIIVEDNEDHSALIEKILKSEHLLNRLHIFEDAETALEYMRNPDEQRHQVIFIDINLPGMSGLELLERLKDDSYLKRIPVAILTTSDSDSDRTTAFNLLANSYITKPFDFQKFRQIIEDMRLHWGIFNKTSITD
jgi:DNA-binding response OmpR family regulator